MDDYKKSIRIRIWLLAIPVVIAAAIGIYDVFLANQEVKETFIFGFQSGIATSLGLLAVFLIARYRWVLMDETRLKLQFNKENDERLKAIRAKAGLPMIFVTSVIMIIAGIIAAYFNAVVFIVLIAAAVCQMTVSATVKQIYMRRM